MEKPIINKVRCKKCNDSIESKHCHDMVNCQLDGGTDYQRYGWSGGNKDDWIDFSYSEYQDESQQVELDNEEVIICQLQ